ncbi:RNA polymerase factor sigma-32 [Paramagnetospirillum kuznetsovii]|uniref:RNA polymerase factor sigma-32 n=1 Tax=Paramagnetospirillum kuznetsovii TaxID=2053833 RepID=A0A364NW39_9PROT|nr:sigma-70 family RNA polymerase sigma factor [Paramagnetospirillum kuznetsovii]RAU21137.1 RNA polymerase factor sigma-32 [Paramagnetospirillum kuznetsovii]
MTLPKTPSRLHPPRADGMLGVEDEIALIRAWRQTGDEAAKSRLITAHLPLVLKAATRFRFYGLAADDLIAEGNLGLLRALDGFEPERGLRFATYAQWWVRACMYEHVLKFSTPVSFSVTAGRKRIFFKLKALKAKLLGVRGGQLSPTEVADIARDLKVSAKAVSEMDRLMSHPARSLDAPLVAGNPTSLGDLLPSESPDAETALGERQEMALRRDALARSWPSLTEREQQILTERALRERPLKLEELAKRFGISRERVRQIEAEAMRKLRRLMVPTEAGMAGA